MYNHTNCGGRGVIFVTAEVLKIWTGKGKGLLLLIDPVLMVSSTVVIVKVVIRAVHTNRKSFIV